MAKQIDFKKIYPDTPQGWASRWKDEFEAAKGPIDKFHKNGDKILKIFLGEQGVKDDRVIDENLNLFYANIETMQSLVYGQLPTVTVDRTFADANDNTARVGAEILSRMLNQDIQDPGKQMHDVFKQAMQDRLMPGMGNGRVRYDCKLDVREIPGTAQPAVNHPETGQEILPAVPAQTEEYISEEWVDICYTHWKDFKWSPARTHAEIRWKAFRSYMCKDEVEKRFGKPKAAEGEETPETQDTEAKEPGQEGDEDAPHQWGNFDIDEIPFNSKGPFGKQTDKNPDSKQIVPQAEVWEIWHMGNRKVYWYVEGFDQCLDCKDDPLELNQFWPDAPPLIANATTSKYMPRADYAIAQDLYAAVDVLQRRISRLTDACKLVGVYDKSNDEIKRLFSEGIENQLIAVDNWAMFAEKGGLDGLVQWLPLKDVIETIEQLQGQQEKKIQQLYDLTGMSDILRGASQQQYTSAEETKTKVTYASVRMQKLQNEFADWVSSLQNLKAEIICKHFQPETIAKQSNIMMTMDAKDAQPAIAFLKRDDSVQFRCKVQPESLAMADYAQMKTDRTEFLMGISQFMQSAQPLMAADKSVTPILLQMLRWALSGFKGSQEIQGIMDQAIKASILAAQNPPPDKPDPKLQAIQAESQAKIEIMQAQGKIDAQASQAKNAMELERAQAQHQADLEKIAAQAKLDEQDFQFKMEIAKANLVVALAKIQGGQAAEVSSAATDLIQHAEKVKMDSAADTATATHGAALEMATDTHKARTSAAVTEHSGDKSKEVASHAAKVQVQSQDEGNGGSGE